jgi:hypothetical protein
MNLMPGGRNSKKHPALVIEGVVVVVVVVGTCKMPEFQMRIGRLVHQFFHLTFFGSSSQNVQWVSLPFCVFNAWTLPTSSLHTIGNEYDQLVEGFIVACQLWKGCIIYTVGRLTNLKGKNVIQVLGQNSTFIIGYAFIVSLKLSGKKNTAVKS